MKYLALIVWLLIVALGSLVMLAGLAAVQPGRLLIKVGRLITVDLADRFE